MGGININKAVLLNQGFYRVGVMEGSLLLLDRSFTAICPPKGTEGGPIVFTYTLFWVRKRILDFSFQER